MNIEISKEYRESLIPLLESILEPLSVPKETFEFLKEVGLPVDSHYEITPNAPLTFLNCPVRKKYPYLQHTYLQIASFDVMGEVAVDLHFGSVHQVQIINDCGYDLAVPNLMNNSIWQFVDCLGLWLSFYPQFREEITARLEADPGFSLFKHKEMFEPIRKKLKETDPGSMRERKFFWRRMCEPDVI